MVSMQFARKEIGYDAQKQVETHTLVDTTHLTAVSSDGGRTFSLRNTKDINRDGDVDVDDQARLLALATAYSRIINP